MQKKVNKLNLFKAREDSQADIIKMLDDLDFMLC